MNLKEEYRFKEINMKIRCLLFAVLALAQICMAATSLEEYAALIRDCGKFAPYSFAPVLSSESTIPAIGIDDIIKCLSETDRELYEKAEAARKKLDALSPAEVWSLTIEAAEKNIFEGEKNQYKTREVIEAALKAGFSEKDINRELTFTSGNLYNAEAEYLLINRCGLKFGNNTGIACVWSKTPYDDAPIPTFQYPQAMYFWWYEGRKYLPEMFREWYACWKNEVSLENPRKNVLEALASDMNDLSYHARPYLEKAVKDGDTSLNEFFSDILAQEKVELASCNGYEGAVKVYNGKNTALSEKKVRNLELYSKAARKFYAEKPEKSNYWYWRLDNAKNYDTKEGKEELAEIILK